jgi:hypothetical protein
MSQKWLMNNYGQQFIPTISTITSHLKSLNIDKPQHMMLGIHVLDGNRHNDMAGLNQLMGSHPFPFNIKIIVFQLYSSL